MLSTLLLPFFLAQGPGLVAAVDDPVSHGAVGDARLSLDEAIRVANGTLAIAALSAAEQARFTGTGPLVQTIVVDAMVTPTITLQSVLTDITAVPAQLNELTIMGMAMPGMPLPVIQGGSQPRVFTLRAHRLMLHGLRIAGGQVGVDVRMAYVGMPGLEMSMLMQCELDGQTTAGVRVHGTGADESKLMVEDCRLTNMPLGFQLDDNTAGGYLQVEGERVAMDQVVLGCRLQENGVGGALSMFMVWRSSFTNGTTLAMQRRSATSGQQVMFRFIHTDATCSGDVLDIEGSATGLTIVHHHHGDFIAGAGHKAYWVWPRTANFDVHGSEMRLVGDVAIAGNLQTLRVWQWNCRFEAGTVTYDVDGALPNLRWNQYDNCAIVVPAAARSPVVFRSCEFVATTLNSAALLAPITLQDSYRSGGSLAGFATEQQPAPTPFLGRTTITPTDPQVGTSVTFAANLPFGLGLVWDVADSYPRPTTTAEPFRLYGDPATLIALPGLYIFQSQVVIPIPAVATLAGLEFYVQGITLPLVAMPYAPPVNLPRGELIRLRP